MSVIISDAVVKQREERTRAILDFSAYENDLCYKVIRLTQGVSTVIDAKDWPLVSEYTWYAHWASYTHSFYAATMLPADQLGKHTTLHMHSLITGYGITDHRDGNTLLNIRSNLRDGTKGNSQNCKMRADNTSGYGGVHWNKRAGKWQAQIMINGRHKYLGFFNEKLDAALAYDMAARELHGQFATLNFPLLGERSALTGEIRQVDPVEYPEFHKRNGG